MGSHQVLAKYVPSKTVRLQTYHRERARRNPSSIDLIKCGGKRPHFSVRNVRSTVMTWETLATESLGRPDSDEGTNTLPGASARRRFEVKTTAMTVRMRLRLKGFDWTIMTGRLNPGSEATGSASCAHQISPRSITTPHGPATQIEAKRGRGIRTNPPPRKVNQGVLLPGDSDTLTGTQKLLWYRAGFEKLQAASPEHRQSEKPYRVWISLSSQKAV
jgi:hypothetical protein